MDLAEAMDRGQDQQVDTSLGKQRDLFANVLVALARHRVDPLWLRKISIQGGGDRVVMSGITLEPEAVPRYLQALGNDSVFKGRIFNAFVIESNSEEEPEHRQFTIDTHTESELPSEFPSEFPSGLPSGVSQGNPPGATAEPSLHKRSATPIDASFENPSNTSVGITPKSTMVTALSSNSLLYEAFEFPSRSFKPRSTT